MRSIATLAVASCLALGVTACGSRAVPTASGATPATKAAAPPGPVIKLGVLGSSAEKNLDSAVDGARAAARTINAAGGVLGRPLQIVSCDIGLDPNQAAGCARDLVAQGVVAAVGSGGAEAGQALPILAHAGVASIGHFSVSQSELLATNAFPIISGGIGFVAGEGDLAARLGAHHVHLVRTDLDSTASLPKLALLGLAPHRLQLEGSVPIPLNPPDMAPYVSTSTDGGADAVLMLLGVDDVVKFSRSAKQTGTTARLVTDAVSLAQAVDQGFAAEVDGDYAVGWFKPADLTGDPAVARFQREMSAISSKAPRSQAAENAWASVYLFQKAAQLSGSATATSITAAMPRVTNFDCGLTPPVSFTEPLTVIPGVPLHVFNPSVFYSRITAGKFAPVSSGFVDVLSPQG